MRLHPDISSLENFYDRGRFLLAWRISMAFSLLFLILTILYGLNSSIAALPASIVVLVSVGSAVYLALTKNYKPLFWVYAIAGSLLAHLAVNLVLSYTHYVDFIWMAICVILAFIGLGWVYGMIFVVAHALGVGYFLFFTLNRHIDILQPKTKGEIIADYIEILFAFFVMAYLMRQYVIFQSHSQDSLQKANNDLAHQNQLIIAKNYENETLMKEIHHRVKNNLQIIISLLRMQSAELKSEESKVHFSEAINRIMTMSLIHQKLYSEKELSKVKLKSYLEQLVTEILKVFQGNSQVDIHIETSVEEVHPDMIVPMALLVNELVSNSLKHAFESSGKGEIHIAVIQKGKAFELDYSDDGKWKDKKENESSFGLELIDILTDQMNGTKSLSIENGTRYHFHLSDHIQH